MSENNASIEAGSFLSDGDNLDKVLPFTKWLAIIIVPILSIAFVMLYLFPNPSELLSAWGIKPRMSAMMLGATYLGGA